MVPSQSISQLGQNTEKDVSNILRPRFCTSECPKPRKPLGHRILPPSIMLTWQGCGGRLDGALSAGATGSAPPSDGVGSAVTGGLMHTVSVCVYLRAIEQMTI